MAYAPIALTIPQYEDYATYWLKAYDQGTTTPLSMATDAAAGTTLVKSQLDAQGFPITSGNARFIPFIQGDYDLWLFPTAAEADANDTTNAIQFADNLNTVQPISNLSANVALTFTTKAAALLETLVNNRQIFITSDDGGAFTMKTGASVGTYNDDGGVYTGTKFTGGDGSEGFLRDSDVELNIKWFGAVGDGTTDDTAAIQATLDAGVAVYFPNANEETYLITSTLVVDGVTYGYSIRADTSARNITHVLQAGASMQSMIQFSSDNASNEIVTNLSLVNMSLDGNDLASIGIAFGAPLATNNQLIKFVYTESLSVKECRIGVQIGAAGSGVETDSAGYTMDNMFIEKCDDYGLYIDSGNAAAIQLSGGTFNENGFGPTNDTLNPGGEGGNVKIIGGEFHASGCTSAGITASGTAPATADIIASSADVRINSWWSDAHGLFLKESGNVGSSTYLSGIRHNEGAMSGANTPRSIEHTCKLTIVGSYLYGKINSLSGQSGALTTIGLNFVSGGAAAGNSTAYEGDLKTDQKGVISINNFGNRAQMVIGGGAANMAHKGFYTPQFLQMGTGSSTTGPACLAQALGEASTDSGFTTYLNESNGEYSIYINCYRSDSSAAGNVAPFDNTTISYVIALGGTYPFRIRKHDFANDTPVALTTFTEVISILGSTGECRIPGVLAAAEATELTIASGAITVNSWKHTVDTESNAASDNLETISGGKAGAELELRAESGTRTVVIGNAGNIRIASGVDFSLAGLNDVWRGTFDEAQNVWNEVSRSTNS